MSKHKNIILFLFLFCFLSTPLLSQIITIDSHIDIPFDYMENPQHDPGKITNMQVDLAKMKKGGLDSGFFVVYVPQGPLDTTGFKKAKLLAEKKFLAISKMTKTYPNQIGLALAPEDIIQLKKNNLLSAAIGIENGYVIGEDLSLLDHYYSLGARYMTLTHIGHNQIADSSMPSKRLNDKEELHGGISAFGKKAIKRMNKLGMMIDISHISDKASLEAIKLSSAPVIASHSCVKSIADHPRNISNELLFALKENGGVIQITAFANYVKVNNDRFSSIISLGNKVAELYGDKSFNPSLHSNKKEYLEGIENINAKFPMPDIDDFIDHLDYVVDLIGIDYVGISSDFGGGGGISGWMDASETKLLTLKLKERGYSPKEIEKIWGGNILRVWKKVENIASKT